MTICLTQKTCRVKVIVLIVGLLCFASVWAKAADLKVHGEEDSQMAIMIYSGRFEGFTMDKAYIDGLGIKLAKDVDLHSTDGDKIHKSKFKRGCMVKFVISHDKEIVMMQIEQQP